MTAWRSRFGAIADPLADKLMMLTVAVMLTLQGSLPWWFTLALVFRDLLIVAGALAYQVTIGPVDIAPTVLSKANTGLGFLLVLAVLAVRAGHASDGVWVDVLLLTTLGTIVLSGAQYVVLWSRKAAGARKPPA
jgi:cardiolipin synthase (CMP-forming)